MSQRSKGAALRARLQAIIDHTPLYKQANEAISDAIIRLEYLEKKHDP